MGIGCGRFCRVRGALDGFDDLRGLARGAHLGDADVREAGAGRADQDVDVLPPRRVARIVDAHARPGVSVGRAGEQARHHFGVLFFPARL